LIRQYVAVSYQQSIFIVYLLRKNTVHMSENRDVKIILAFVVGAAIGTLVGYFLNSNKKDELLTELKEGATDLKDGLSDSLGKAKEFVDNLNKP